MNDRMNKKYMRVKAEQCAGLLAMRQTFTPKELKHV
jgi:hypothetical protein